MYSLDKLDTVVMDSVNPPGSAIRLRLKYLSAQAYMYATSQVLTRVSTCKDSIPRCIPASERQWLSIAHHTRHLSESLLRFSQDEQKRRKHIGYVQ